MKSIFVPNTPNDAMFRERPTPYTPGSTRPIKPDGAPPATAGEAEPATEPSAPPIEPDGASE